MPYDPSDPQLEGPRACRKDELPEVIALVDDAMRQGTDQSMLTDYPLLYGDKNLPDIRVIKASGKVASVVPFVPRDVLMDDCRFRVGIISATATDPPHRRKGYGLRCLNSCIERMEQVRCELSVLWTLEQTFAFYEKGGYQAVRSQGWVFRGHLEDADLFRDRGEKIVPYRRQTRQYLEDIRSMHERGVFGVLRAPDEYPILFSLPKMETLIALRDGCPTAYLLVSSALNKPGLLEAGGDEQAVETLLNHALSRLDEGGYWDAWANLTPSVLGDLFERKMPGSREPQTQGPMMVRVNDVGGFFEKIGPWLEKRNAGERREFSIRVTDADEVISFHFSEQGLRLRRRTLRSHMQLSRRELTSVVFGPHPARPVTIPPATRGLFPFYFPIPVLDHS